jgi:hypothetical protein
MTHLTEALETLGLTAETSLAGRWTKLHGERCAVYVIEAAWAAGFYSWCDDPLDRVVEHHSDPIEAIRAGLKRASDPKNEADVCVREPRAGG